MQMVYAFLLRVKVNYVQISQVSYTCYKSCPFLWQIINLGNGETIALGNEF
jgi:hypothetical protein